MGRADREAEAEAEAPSALSRGGVAGSRGAAGAVGGWPPLVPPVLAPNKFRKWGVFFWGR